MKKEIKDIIDGYFVAIYDSKDNVKLIEENLLTTSKVLNIPLKELLRKIRNNDCININGHRGFIYLYEKENIEENYRRKICR